MIPSRLSAARAALLAFAAVALAATLQAANVRVYIQYGAGQKSAAQAALNQASARTHHVFDDLNAVAVTLPQQAVAALERNPAVVLVEEDPVREYLSSSQQVPYGIGMVQATQAWPSTTGTGVKVGVIDSGVHAGHADFVGVTITGEPYHGATDERTWSNDVLAHGTHVVGTIAAANNTIGVVGVSPSVAIHMVKVFGDSGNWIYSSDLLSAARAAANAGCRIISMSLGGGWKSRTEERGLNDLYNTRGILLVAAAGNGGNNAHSYPASYSSVISVAAIDSSEQVASFSQKNSQVELAAPGVAVLSTVSYLPSSVSVNGSTYAANNIEGSAPTNATGNLVDGGRATSVPTDGSWTGKVVLVERGDISFHDKVKNVQSGGGAACVIYNNEPGTFFGTLGSGNSSTIPAVSVSQADGQAMKSKLGQSTTVTNSGGAASGYDYFDGTSMATPHVSGVAALIWSKHTSLTNAELRQVLRETARDLPPAGRDNASGYGLVQAKAALDKLAGTTTGNGGGSTGGGGGSTTTIAITGGPTHQVTNAKNGSFDILWTTNVPGTSDVEFMNIGWYTTTTLTTNHKRSFRGSKGQSYTYRVRSIDASGNQAMSDWDSFTLP
jgi:serine protease